MSTKYRFTENEVPHFITMTLVEWIDLFSREKYKELVLENLKFCIKEKGLIVHAYVVMTNHLHRIVRSEKDKNLAGIIRDFKRFTAKKIYEELKQDNGESRQNWMLWIMESQGKKSSSNKNYKVWRHENHPSLGVRVCVGVKNKDTTYNPVEAGFVDNPEDYRYSSARDYSGGKGLLDVALL